MQRHTIVGIDPGATVGVALLDLSGSKVATASFRGGGIAEAIRFIERHGTPSLVACDVQPPPEMAQKIASYFSCRLFRPPQDVREEDKRQIAREAGVQNNHERDAYSAAVLAYREYANKLRQVDALEGLLSGAEKDSIKHLILRGYRMKDAVLSLRAGQERREREASPAPEPQAGSQKPPEEIRARLSLLARENANLRLMLSRLEEEKEALLHRLRLLENGARQAMMRDSEIRSLRFRLEKLAERMQGGRRQGKGGANKPHHGGQQQKRPVPTEGKREDEGALYNLGEPEIDLEKLVAEYRKGKK